MITIGQFFKTSRREKKYTISDLEWRTKIKKEFLKAIEEEKWHELPEYTILLGFIKSIAHFLDVDEQKAVSLFRRDYPPKKIVINPSPDLKTREWRWSPKVTFFLGIAIAFLVIAGYLVFQYTKFVSPPELLVYRPEENAHIQQKLVEVVGKTDADATLKINNQPVLLDKEGNFQAEVEVFEGTKELEIVATSRSSKESVIRRKINVELK